jgi:hypothetical protein
MVIEAILFLAVALGIAYLSLQYMSSPSAYQGTALYDLSIPQQKVLPNSICPWTAAPYSIRFAIQIAQAPRTVSKVDCISSASPATSFQPSCDDSSFNTCSCSAANCSRCDIQKNSYLTKLLNVGDNVELWASGYTSPNDKPYVPALLKIRTGADSNQHYMESVPLPAIPLQRWTVITIVKEGRRFDVYYGGKAVATKLCSYVPIPPSSGSDWIVGASGWLGKIGLFSCLPKSKSADDVNRDVESLVNTRGIPFYLDELTLTMPTFPTCLFGNCNSLPTVKPTNPFAAYLTNVQ